MNENRKRELAAAIKEAQTNLDTGALDVQMAREDVSVWDEIIGKRRGQSWKDFFTSVDYYETTDDLRQAIVKDDPKFQARLKAAKEKTRAQIASWQAELDALTTAETAKGTAETAEAAAENLVPNAETLDAAADAVASFIEDGTEKEKTALEEKIEMIKRKREDLIKELRRLADPSGEVDWSNARAVDEFLRNNPTAAAIQNQALQVDASAQNQIARAQAEDAQRQENERRAAEEKRLQEERAAAEARAKGEKDLAEAMRERFEKFASPAEKLALAEQDLQKAVEDLTAAQQSGDSGTIAAALRRLSDTEDKYVSAAEAVDKIGENVGKSMGGTFSAWQASTAASVGFEKQTLNEQKRQTNYLRQIYSAMQRNGNGGAVFA